MVSLKSVEQQLKQIGCNFRFWGRPEIIELAKILMPDEKIAQCVNGTYEGGFALLVATDHRILLIDKKPMYLTLDDIRYDMVSDVNYSHRLMDASINIMTTGNKTLFFRAFTQWRLRKIMDHVQHRVTEVRRRQDKAEKAETKIADQIDEVENTSPSTKPALQQIAEQPSQPALAMQQLATENTLPPDSFNGFRRHVSVQIARYIGPRAVAFSQFPPVFNGSRLPFASRRFTQPTR